MLTDVRKYYPTIVVFALSLAPMSAQAQNANLFEGIWDLNVAESTFGPDGGPQSEVRYYENRGDGVVHATFEGVNADGEPTFTQYAAKHDGRPYPMSTGTLRQSIEFNQVDAFSSDWIIRVGREVVTTGNSSVSLDGRTYTVRARAAGSDGPETVSVYDKRR